MSIHDQDKFIQRTMRAFLQAQAVAYAAGIPNENEDIARSQAVYEVACLAMITIARFVAKVPDDEPLPALIGAAAIEFHNAICETGDAQLRKLGYKPEEF